MIFEFDGSSKSGTRRKIRAEYGEQALSLQGESVTRDAIDQLLLELSEEITGGHDHGKDRPYEDWIRLLIDRIDPNLGSRLGRKGLEDFGAVIDQSFIESPPRLIDGAIELLENLSGMGLKIGLISNTGLTSPATYRKWFSQIGLLEWFDYLAFSNGEAVAKPNKRIFDVTLGALDVAPERTLHIGDNLHTDVGGAAAAGMSTVWVRGGIKTPVVTEVRPDYTIDTVLELEHVVERWLETQI
ncbi:MAG: HAD family hydrolase [Chloroflexi bacterium]|nr:HAD family hydrolase [Chloroflexota bacterium]